MAPFTMPWTHAIAPYTHSLPEGNITRDTLLYDPGDTSDSNINHSHTTTRQLSLSSSFIATTVLQYSGTPRAMKVNNNEMINDELHLPLSTANHPLILTHGALLATILAVGLLFAILFGGFGCFLQCCKPGKRSNKQKTKAII